MSSCETTKTGSHLTRSPWNCLLKVAALASAGLLALISTLALTSATAMAAGSGYYTPPPQTVVPGGFTAVVTSQVISPAGAVKYISLGNGVQLEIDVPPGTFNQNVVVTIFTPDLISIGDAGIDNYHAVAGLRFIVTVGSSLYSGPFDHFVTFTLTSRSITSASKVVIWNGTSFVTYSDATVSNGQAVIRVDSDPDFAVLSPNVAPTVIPSSTTVTTGEPFFGEELLAGVLLLVGLGGLFVVVRKRRRVTRPA